VAAQDGTIFLDEIGELPLELQPKLLRVLQEKEVRPIGSGKTKPINARVLAATNLNLPELAKRGKYRLDLLFRLAVVQLEVPPLRKRQSDIPLLVAKFIGDIYKLTGKQYQVSQGLLEYLMAQEWRGNVRELENLLQRMCVFTPNSIIRKEDLPNGATPYIAPETDTVRPLKEIELEAIHQALRITRGNYSEAAKLLGVTKSTLYRKVRPSTAFPSMFGQV